MKIYGQKGRILSQAEQLELAGLLIKAGYTVRLTKIKVENRSVAAIEYTGGTEEE